MAFALDPRLAHDTIFVWALEVCDLLIMNEARYPWAILVPRVAGACELHDMDEPLYLAVMTEVQTIARAIGSFPEVEKVNIGALGNIVRQLHVHVVGRSSGDPAWPGPVWGHSPPQVYEVGAEASLLTYLRGAL